MKRIIMLIYVSLTLTVSLAATWRNLDDTYYYSGAKLTENDLLGKVVLVHCWGVNCPPCRASLPLIEKTWKSFKTKPFIVIGSHRQKSDPERIAELVKENKLTYPMYSGAGLSEGEPSFRAIPFYYVVNHRGKVVYAGNSYPDATEAIVTSIGAAYGNYNLTGCVILKKYKPIEKKLVFGKNITSVIKKLQNDVKKAESKRATAMQKEMAVEAGELLAAIEETKSNIKADYDILVKKDAAAAEKLSKDFKKTFSEDL